MNEEARRVPVDEIDNDTDNNDSGEAEVETVVEYESALLESGDSEEADVPAPPDYENQNVGPGEQVKATEGADDANS